LEDNLCRVSIETSEYLRFDLAARKNVVAEMLAQGLEIGSILKIGSDAQNDLYKLGWTQDDFKNLGAKPGSTSRLTLTTKKGAKEVV